MGRRGPTPGSGGRPRKPLAEKIAAGNPGKHPLTMIDLPIDKLVPYARNARTHSKEQIAQLRSSLREFGFVSPVIIDNDYNIIAGHGRVAAAKEEGYKTVPCVFAENLTEAQKRAYILADNRLAMNAGWDEEMLAVELSDLQADAFDVSLLGFTDAELNKLSGAAENVKEDDFDVDEELKKPTVTKLGDLWLLGNHRLVCGDSTKADTFTLLMDGKLANLTVTDPPYNVNYEGNAGKIQNDNMADDKFYQFLFDAFSNTEKAMADDASIYVFHADTEGLNFRKAFADAGFYLSGTCIWKKQSLVLGRSPYQWQHEPILFGWKKTGKHEWYSDRKQSTIWEFDKPKKNAGSTLIACEQTGRICDMIELDEKYCDVIVKRYIEQIGNADGVFLIRNGEKIAYGDLPDEEKAS
jgi:DNA modification methylase